MAEMAAAAAAMNFGPRNADLVIGAFADRVEQRLPEARPARAAVELGLRGKQRQFAAGAVEEARALFMIERARARTFRSRLPQHGELFGRQKRFPLFRCFGDLKTFGMGLRHRHQTAPDESTAKGGRAAEK